MKVLIVAVFCAFAQNSLAQPTGNTLQKLLTEQTSPRALNDKIEAVISCVQNILKNGDAELNISSMDPLKFHSIEVDLETMQSEMLTGTVKLSNVVIGGIPNWDVKKLQTSITIIPLGAKFDIELDWAGISVEGDYNVDAVAMERQILGNGHGKAVASGINIEISLHATLTRISLKRLSIRPTIEELKVNVTDMTVDDIDISEDVSEVAAKVPDWAEANLDEIDKILSQFIMEIINKVESKLQYSIVEDILSKCLATVN